MTSRMTEHKIKTTREFKSIRKPVFLTLILLAVVPITTAYYGISKIVDSSVSLGLNPEVLEALNRSGQQLKDLARLNPSQKMQLHSRFLELQDLRLGYQNILNQVPHLKDTYQKMFLLFFTITLMAALGVALWLSRSIIRIHSKLLGFAIDQQRRALAFEHRESWQLVAQKLVHEINNPLTPIQVMMSRLKEKIPSPEIEQATAIVTEEIKNIRRWVDSFSQFARTPKPKLERLSVREEIQLFLERYKNQWPNLLIEFEPRSQPEYHEFHKVNDTVELDRNLFQQVLFNLLKNSAEAMEETPTNNGTIQLELKTSPIRERSFSLTIQDNGPGIPLEMRKHLFQPYATSKKTSSQVRGLGLPFCHKILSEQGHELVYLPPPTSPGSQGTCFEIRFNGSS